MRTIGRCAYNCGPASRSALSRAARSCAGVLSAARTVDGTHHVPTTTNNQATFRIASPPGGRSASRNALGRNAESGRELPQLMGWAGGSGRSFSDQQCQDAAAFGGPRRSSPWSEGQSQPAYPRPDGGIGPTKITHSGTAVIQHFATLRERSPPRASASDNLRAQLPLGTYPTVSSRNMPGNWTWCQATGETDPLPTLKLTPPSGVFVNQREPATPASAHGHPKLPNTEWTWSAVVPRCSAK